MVFVRRHASNSREQLVKIKGNLADTRTDLKRALGIIMLRLRPLKTNASIPTPDRDVVAYIFIRLKFIRKLAYGI